MFRLLSRTSDTILIACVVAAAFAAPASAQNLSGTISGTVVDEQKQVVPGATISIINEATNDARVGVTTPNGDFQVTNLLPGTYTVRVEMSGFRTAERRRNVLSAAERLSVGTIVLQIGAIGETITVEATGTQVNPAETQHSGLITSRQIEQIQVKGRDVTSLMRLVPGVRYEDTVESLGESFGTLIPHVGGQRRDWNTVMVDGVLGNEIGQANRMAQQINLDAVAEIKILLNTYRAEYGRTGGGQIQIISKSGSSRYSGNAYYYGRHERFNANSFFNNRASREKPRYRFNTYGFNLGGPVPGVSKDRKNLLFFYSLEAPITERPGSLLSWTMPTERERRGDFSQTLDSAGRLIVIRDPVTGQPFPGNVIPAHRINSNGQALLNVLPMPTLFDRSFTQGQFNHQTQAIADNPKLNQILRVDWRPSANDSFYFTFKDWRSDQRGVGGAGGVTAGPAGWGWFNAHYLNTDRGGSANYTRIIRANLVNEAAFGIRQQTEQFHPVTEADWDRARRSTAGYTLGQFHPELNPEGVLPKATFNVPNSPNFTFDNRLAEKGEAWLYSFRNDLTWVSGSHSFKSGVYLERLHNSEGKGGVGAGPWAGQFTFTVDTNNPFDTGHSFANALLGSFRDYTEVDAFPEVQARRWLTEWYIQDTWKASSRLTIDYGMRFLWYQPWYTELDAAVFVPERYDPAQAPRLYRPARINNANVALDPVTGEVRPNIFVGSFVPGTGDPYNGMVTADDPDYPRGFRDNQGIHPEPRVGFGWDVFGDGTTAVHSSAGIYHNAHITARSMDSAANNPPAVNTPQVIYGTMDALLQGAAFSSRPSNAFGLERDAKTPTSYNWSIGVQRDIGWGTVVDVTYSGNTTRHLEVVRNINVVPDGARFLDQNPQNRNPQNPNNPLPSEFLRPYSGYQNINIRSHFGTSDYHGLQVQVNRRYIRGLQFAVAYTLGKTKGIADEDEAAISYVRPIDEWNYAPYSSSQTHNLVINYTWDLPKPSHVWNNGVVRAVLDNWQLSGENAFVSGDWAPVFLATTDNFDFTGGDGGSGTDVGGGVRTVRPRIIGDVTGGNRSATPGAAGSWLNWDAFARPSGRGDYGNAPRTVFQLPGISNWNLSFFKNVPIGGTRRLQFRWEIYNLLNHTQFSAIDGTARFDAAGVQVNQQFGKATAARNPRIMQGAIRFTF
ncbi:MAG TPA: carboxypeptidase regulatory-like domain-containing protein [Vicinamibacterales bacterium]|nr:carboxypeptidase regulatory-like domain-containing protein [Vicinamibacterales bacterium]